MFFLNFIVISLIQVSAFSETQTLQGVFTSSFSSCSTKDFNFQKAVDKIHAEIMNKIDIFKKNGQQDNLLFSDSINGQVFTLLSNKLLLDTPIAEQADEINIHFYRLTTAINKKDLTKIKNNFSEWDAWATTIYGKLQKKSQKNLFVVEKIRTCLEDLKYL